MNRPTSALDPEMVKEVLDVMVEMGFARTADDRVVFVADGEIVEESRPDEFFSNPRSDRAKAFLRRSSSTDHN